MTSSQKSKLSELLKKLARDNGDPQAWNQLY